MYGHAHTCLYVPARPMPFFPLRRLISARARRANASLLTHLLHEIYLLFHQLPSVHPIRPRKTQSSCSRVERLCGPERDMEGGPPRPSCPVLCAHRRSRRLVWSGSGSRREYVHLCCARRHLCNAVSSLLAVPAVWSSLCSVFFVRLCREFGLPSDC